MPGLHTSAPTDDLGIGLEQTWGFADPGWTFDNGLAADQRLFGLVDTQCISDEERQQLTEQGYNTDQATRWLPYNTTLDSSRPPNNASSPVPQSVLARECLYLHRYLVHLAPVGRPPLDIPPRLG